MAISHSSSKFARTVGSWELVEPIAESGMGTVYKAHNRASGQIAAVKVMPPFHMGKEQAFQRFARECRILSALHDPHIVRAIDFGIEGAEPYLVMEYVEGETLRARVERTGGIPEDEALRLVAEAAGALGRAHARGLVHRNVTPDSILIRGDGQAMLTDLCLVKEVDAGSGVTRDGASLGSPNFMAPEQFRDAAKATRKCDIYSLAATLYMAVTGRPPFAGCHLIEMVDKKLRGGPAPPRTLLPSLSERTERAIRRAMSSQPMHRPETCEEFVDNLTGTADFEVPGEPKVEVNVAPVQAAPAPVAPSAPAAVSVQDQVAGGSDWSWLAAIVAPFAAFWRWFLATEEMPAEEPAPLASASSVDAPDGRRQVPVRKVCRTGRSLPMTPESPA